MLLCTKGVFMKFIILILLVVSCGKGGSGSSVSETPNNLVSGSSYALPITINPYDSFGYELDYSCDTDTCQVNGTIVRRYTTAATMAYFDFNGELTRTPTGYQGVIEAEGLGLTYEIKLNESYRIVAIADTTKCMSLSQDASRAQFDTYFSSFSDMNKGMAGLNSSTWGSKSLCGF